MPSQERSPANLSCAAACEPAIESLRKSAAIITIKQSALLDPMASTEPHFGATSAPVAKRERGEALFCCIPNHADWRERTASGCECVLSCVRGRRGPLAQSVEQLTSFGVTVGKPMAEKVSKSGNPSASRRRQSRAKPQKWGRCRGLMAPAYVPATG